MSAPAKGKKPEIEIESVNMGFQIAPMVDVVFVIMLFFMAMAASVKVEHELKTSLPGISVAAPEASDQPDEILIAIDEDGNITMNEESYDDSQDPAVMKAMPELTRALARLREDAQGRGSKVLVTIQTEEQAKYERVIDVMNSLAKAKIQNVTFTVGEEEF